MSLQWQEGTLEALTGLNQALGADAADQSALVSGITPEYTHFDLYILATVNVTTPFSNGDTFADLYMQRRVSGTEESDFDGTSGRAYPISPNGFLGSAMAVDDNTTQAEDVIFDLLLPSNDFIIVVKNRYSSAYESLVVKLLPKRFADL